jgi:putative aldouronate transport system permease protein
MREKITYKKLWNQRYLLILSVPFLVLLIVFAYVPLVGWLMAFQDYKPNLGLFHSKWVGLYQFERMFTDPILAPKFRQVLKNTLGMSFLGLIFGFFTSITFAVFLNEMQGIHYKKAVQTISYLPHFVSWVIVANIVSLALSPSGTINDILIKLGILSEPINFMAKPKLFWWIITFSDVWKETGWNAIIYIAAITSIDPQLYEAALVDGATRLQRIWHITLPSIRSTIVMLLILSIGNLINIGFEKQWLMSNTIVAPVAEVLDKYIIDYGISNYNFSYGTALGIFKSVISIVLVFTANRIAKKYEMNIL